MAKPFGFGKKEKLKSRKQIDILFARGKSFSIPPIRVTYQFLPVNEAGELKAGVTVSKRNFKKAVDRNRIKRLLREGYRLQKQAFSEAVKQKNMNGYLFFTYTDKTIQPYSIIETCMQQCLKRLQKKLNESDEKRA